MNPILNLIWFTQTAAAVIIGIRFQCIISTKNVELVGVFGPMELALVPAHGRSARGCGVMCVIVPP